MRAKSHEDDDLTAGVIDVIEPLQMCCEAVSVRGLLKCDTATVPGRKEGEVCCVGMINTSATSDSAKGASEGWM